MGKDKKERYVAYVSTYTMGIVGETHGIRIYDVDLENGRFIEKDKVNITNSSFITISNNGKYLYSITDFGVEAFKIQKDGELQMLSHASINGMRGCYLATDCEDKFLFVAGYHDGKLTVLRLNEDGSVGEITDEIFHKGMGCIVERNFRPHINCARMTHDNKYLLVADQGMDYINVYRLNHEKGKLKLTDIIRSELESDPRLIRISKDGRFIYILHEWKCNIDVHSYEERNGHPHFEKIQSISTMNEGHAVSLASALKFSQDYQYLLSSNAGGNTVIVYNVNQEDGTLIRNFCLPISGDYPKDADLFPNNKFIVSLNHESNYMTFFKADLEKGTIVMNGPKMNVNAPNCVIFKKI